MIEFLATALAAFMIPATPLNTAFDFKQTLDNDNFQIVQTSENDVSAYANENSITIKTPNGSNAQASIASEDLSENMKVAYMNYFKSHPEYNLNPETLDVATFAYNSFSFAFYKYWVTDAYDCNLYNLLPFLEDKSFIEVSSPQVDDIILYYTEYYENGVRVINPIHSGIVKEVYSIANNGVCGSANTVSVISKWDFLGLYLHKGDECPFTEKYSSSANFFGFNIATNVTYYRRHKTHSYTYYKDESTHRNYCECGEYIEKHNYTGYVNNGLKHTATCSCGAVTTERHSYTSYTKKDMEVHYANCKCGARITQAHDYYIDRLGNKICGYCKQDYIKPEIIMRLTTLPLEELFNSEDIILNLNETTDF